MEMDRCPDTITVEGERYVRKARGCRHVCVLDRGWIFVGDLTVDPDGTHHIANVYNIRKWERNGFGGMLESPKKAGAILDGCRNLSFKNPLFVIPVPNGWENG